MRSGSLRAERRLNQDSLDATVQSVVRSVRTICCNGERPSSAYKRAIETRLLVAKETGWRVLGLRES
jgi:hypothetical protein